MDILFFSTLLALLATASMLVLGIINMAFKRNAKISSNLMKARVTLQGVTVILAFLITLFSYQ
jgi:hypothetical protein